MHSFRDHALALAQDGFRVFPLAPGLKTPVLDTNWQRIATTDPDKIHALWTDPVTGWDQPFNIGIALDANTIVVDVDVRDGRRGAETLRLLEAIHDPLPGTFWVRTASKGDHHYFRVDGKRGPFAKTLGTNVDLKTLGGYVVGPGSVVDGKRYTVVSGAPGAMQDLPEAFLEISRATAPERSPAGAKGAAPLVELDEPGALARATEWLATAPESVEGDRGDDTAFIVAAKMLDFGLSPDAARDAMLDHWNDRCSPPWSFEEIETKLANAAKYRKSPIGVASPEAEFEPVEIVDRRKKPKRAKLYYERWREVHESTGAPYLVKGWYDLGAMVVTYGESNSGKTNVVLSQAFAVATGAPWGGARTRQGLVVYVAAEGGAGVRKRISAHHKKFGAADIPFALVPCPVDLLRPAGDTKALIELIAAAEADFGQRCVMVVLDTLSRVLAGGNENAPDDMGALVIHCDRIREATGATVHLIHHSGKNTAAGARGHSSLRAATDTEIEIADGQIVGKKQRDMERMSALSFEYEKVELGIDQDGDPITTIVTHVRKETEFETKLTGQAEQMLSILVAMQDDAKAEKGETGVAWKDWQEACLGYVTAEEKKPVKRTQLFRVRHTLSQAGFITKTEANRWVAVDLSHQSHAVT